MVGLGNGHIHKNLTKNGEPQRLSWGMQKKKKKKVQNGRVPSDWSWQRKNIDKIEQI